ncbi:MAG: IclR family transcriptional regulator [Hyphomicrobiales bacterium]
MDRQTAKMRTGPARRRQAPPMSTVPRARPRAVVTRQVPAVSRAIAILRLLGKSDRPLGVHAVANALGLVPSTCLHILRVLVAEELAFFDAETKRYSLAAGILSIARGLLRKDSFNDVARPCLDTMSRRWNATAVGVEAIGLEHVVVVAISRADQALRLRVEIGSRFPALISATGRCLAAFGNHPQAEIEQRFGKLRWDNPPSLRSWRSEVGATRASGYAIDEGRYIAGVTIIAAPVFSSGVATHALVIVGVSEQLRRVGYETIGQSLRAEAAELSERLKGAG